MARTYIGMQDGAPVEVRITRTKPQDLYLVALPQGISGFPKPSIPALVTYRCMRKRLYVPWHDQGVNVFAATFRMDDGHLPDYQPRGNFAAAQAHLNANPWSYAALV